MTPDEHHASASQTQEVPVTAALHIVALYAVFAGLWILLSDRAVVWLFSDSESIARASTLKGWFFVAVTSALLAGLIGRLLKRLNHSLAVGATRERALQESERLLQDSQRIAGLGSYVFDLEARAWKGSIVCDEVFGIQAGEDHSVAGWLNLIHPEDRDAMERYLAHVLEGSHRFDRQYRIVRPSDGAERWVHGLGQLESDDQGRPTVMRGTIKDVTDAKRAELRVEAVRNRLQATLDALPDLLFEVDANGRIFNYHSHRADLLAAAPQVFLGRCFTEVLPDEVARVCQSAIDEAGQHGYSCGHSYALRLPQGQRWFELSVAPMARDEGREAHFIVIARDITARHLAEEGVELAARVFLHAREGITIADAQGTILDVNEAFTRITGYAREEVIGQNPRLLQSGRQDATFYEAMWRDLIETGGWSGEIWNRRKNGEVYAELLTISAVRDDHGKTTHYVAVFTDISAFKTHQEQLEHMAHFDALTGLPNRLLLADRLQQAMSQSQRRGTRLAVAFVDLDGFKAVNDNHGHQLGDALLVELAHRMKNVLRDGDTLARLGGDEFVAVLLDLESPSHCTPLLARLLGVAQEMVDLSGVKLRVSASLGVSFYPQPVDLDADQLLRQADQAMYQAKLAGKNRFHVFDAEHDSSIRDHHETLEQIRRALTEGEFVLHYQPKVNLRNGCVVGAEALIRWHHPQRGLLAPALFLPAVENHPLAVDLGEWVIATALAQMAQWRVQGLDLPVSVNVAARQLQQSDFALRLAALLEGQPQVPAQRLELEILETSALEDMVQVSQLIEDCSRLGVQFALDDFGTGYSSLTYLKKLQVAVLKIDQSFVRDMLEDPDDLAILQGVIGLAGAFRRQVLAEGVETVEHGRRLLQLGCELAQGYGIARPMPAADVAGWIETWRADPSWCALQGSS